jgi:hypothetical protein
MFENIKNINFNTFVNSFKDAVRNVSSEMVHWITVLILHAATLPSLLAVMTGLSMDLPPVDIVLMIWAALTALFIKAAIKKHMLILVTIGLGFVVQSTMLALIFFR